MFDPVVQEMIERFYQMGVLHREQGVLPFVYEVEHWVTDCMRENNHTSRVVFGWLVLAFQDGYNGIALVFE